VSTTSFEGFPAGALKATAIPNQFFYAVLPEIDSLDELKLTLDVLWRLQEKRGYPRFATLSEIVADSRRFNWLSTDDVTDNSVRQILSKAVDRAMLLHLTVVYQDRSEDIYLVNDAQGRKAVVALRSGDLDIGQEMVERPDEVVTPRRSNIYTLYEQNVGLLTPIIAEQLQDAEKLYPADWVEEAIQIAVENNKRSWRYIQAILERWAFEGKTDSRKRR
jgi:DnaD/phage-associated family protein